MSDPKPSLDILHCSVDSANAEGEFRVLVDGKHFKHITIEANLYEADDMCFFRVFVPQLPPFPSGDWNVGHIAKDPKTSAPHIAWTKREALPSINHHLTYSHEVDYLSLNFGKTIRSNVCEVTTPSCSSPMIAKSALWPWEIPAFECESEAYCWLEGHNIGPKFLGYLKEEDRTIGFLLEKVQGHHPTPNDLQGCSTVLSELHALGILHGDVNKHNFLVSDAEVTIVDFENARKCDDRDAMAEELIELEKELWSTSRKGGTYRLPLEIQEEDEAFGRENESCLVELLD